MEIVSSVLYIKSLHVHVYFLEMFQFCSQTYCKFDLEYLIFIKIKPHVTDAKIVCVISWKPICWWAHFCDQTRGFMVYFGEFYKLFY